MGKKVYAVIAAIMVTALIMPSAGTSNTAYAYFGDTYSEEQSKKSTLEEVLKLPGKLTIGVDNGSQYTGRDFRRSVECLGQGWSTSTSTHPAERPHRVVP